MSDAASDIMQGPRRTGPAGDGDSFHGLPDPDAKTKRQPDPPGNGRTARSDRPAPAFLRQTIIKEDAR